jgi:outer membrane murein-binding lipoprotein Lpp
MTNLGKTLVLLNLVLSLVFVAWGVGLVTNQVPWNTPQSSDGARVQGMVETLQKEIERLRPAQQSADNRWTDGYVEVLQLEKQRPDNERLYADLLKSVRQGGVADINPPVQVLEFQPNGPLALKRSGRPPLTLNGQPSLPAAGYAQAIRDTLQKIQQAEDEVKRLNAETGQLTTQINGTKPRTEAKTAAEKGLRVQLAEQEEMLKGLQLEQQYLHSPLTYTTLQTAQLRRRQAELAARLDELTKAAAAVGKK